MILKTKAIILFAVFSLEIYTSEGFSFDGNHVPCKGETINGYSKMKEQYKRCNATVYKEHSKGTEAPDSLVAILCTAQCVMLEDKLIDTKTGKPNKEGLKNYKDMFDKIPEKVRKSIKKTFDDCFEKNKGEKIYDASKPKECGGVQTIANCIKEGIDAACK